MAFAALDYYYAKKPIPSMTSTPPNVQPLAKHIKERLYDSLGLKLGSITNIDKPLKFIIWTKMKAKDIGPCPDCIPGIRSSTDNEAAKLESIIHHYHHHHLQLHYHQILRIHCY